MIKKTKEEKLLDNIKRLYQNYGIDILVMGEDEFQRILGYYKLHPDQLSSDMKKSGIHANSFSDVDII